MLPLPPPPSSESSSSLDGTYVGSLTRRFLVRPCAVEDSARVAPAEDSVVGPEADAAVVAFLQQWIAFLMIRYYTTKSELGQAWHRAPINSNLRLS